MYNKLPPPTGKVTKVVFDGVRPGSPEAQLLLRRTQAEITHFHTKARQQQQASESPSGHMHQALPGGGRMTYSYNNGMEVIHVWLEPELIEAVVGQPPEPRYTVLTPTLAIDVLFTPQVYSGLVGYTYTLTTEGGPGTPGSYGPWTTNDPYLNPPNPTGIAWPTDPDDPVTFEAGPIVTFYGNAFSPNFYGQFSSDNPATDPTDHWFYDVAVASAADADTAVRRQQLIFGILRYPARPGGLPEETQAALWGADFFYRVYNEGTPGPTEVEHYREDRRRWFDVFNVGGLIGDPDGDDPYKAKELGGNNGSTTDDRLQPCSDMTARHNITRTLAVADPAPANFTGMGFVALPTEPQLPGAEPTKTVIDLYLATSNFSKRNGFKGWKDGDVNLDHESFEYEAEPDETTFHVRVREFGDTSPVAVKVTVTTDMEQTIGTGSGSPFESGGIDEFEVTTEPSNPERTVVWSFAAASDWTDSGQEPAKPDAVNSDGVSTMGELLDEFGTNTRELAHEEPQRKLYTTAEWAGEIDAMTKICRIEWTPPARIGEKGTATITAA